MNDLQLSLIAIGGAAVVGVYGYNKWQESQQRKVARQMLRSDHADVLLDAAPGKADADERVEPVIRAADDPQARAQEDATAGQPAGPAEAPRELIDPGIECVVRFESAEMIGGGYLWQAQNQALGKLTKPCRWIGLNERTGAWETITANTGGTFRRMRAALQFADRRGALSDGEITLFFNGLQRIADEFLAVVDIPPRAEMLARAADLDRFCAGVDIQIGVNVIAASGASGAAFAGTKVRGLAEAAGLVLREDGMFHAEDDSGRTLYTLSNLEPALFDADEMKVLTTHGITLTVDVPCVADGAAGFGRMVALARQMATSLDGIVVDDNRAPLADSALEVIRAKIVEIEEQMASRGIEAGGAQALRLFS